MATNMTTTGCCWCVWMTWLDLRLCMYVCVCVCVCVCVVLRVRATSEIINWSDIWAVMEGCGCAPSTAYL